MAKKYKHRHYNSPQPLIPELAALVGDKKKIKLVDIGGGPFPVTGELLDGVEVELHLTDKRDYSKSWEDRGLVPRIPVEYQNMEELTFGLVIIPISLI